jgi:hypothetical protein
LTFEFYRFRFQFRAAGALYFPPYRSGNIVRGAFGSIFRKLVCVPGCVDAKICEVRGTCPYARVFEPRAAHGEGPSGLADWPRPFVFRASHLDGSTVPQGSTFHFDVNIFDVRDPALEHFVRAFRQLAHEGLGPGRRRAELEIVEQLDLSGATLARVFEEARCQVGKPAKPSKVDIGGAEEPVERVKVHFVTPAELKGGLEMGKRPEFPILFGRLRDRISTLRALYGPGPLEVDFRAMGQRAAAIKMIRCAVKWTDAERRSSRSGQRHSIGGFVGEAEYEGELGTFIDYLRLGRWVGVGRQTVWGKGEIVVEADRL